jgi:PIN domain nuclease of toxin-antitoxin system
MLSLKRGWFKIIQDEMKANAIHWLPVEMLHCAELTKLPFHHRDPFDRMLIAQAMVEDLQLLSRDERLSAYEIKRIW